MPDNGQFLRIQMIERDNKNEIGITVRTKSCERKSRP